MANFFCGIKDLTLHSRAFFIHALVIAKTEKKLFNSRQNGSVIGVITFTVRDTKDHFINCTVWGTDHFIENCDRAYKMGDVIAIYQASVSQKNSNSEYHPRTSSPFELRVDEGKSFIHRVTEQFEHLLQLQNQAIKSTSLALKLDDLNICPGSGFLTVDLLVLVKWVEPVREVQTKFGQKALRKVHLLDTTSESISMTVWHADYQSRMEQWVPLQTILHLVDVRAEHSDFERATVLSVTAKTLIVENPIRSSRSAEILAYIHSLSMDKINSLKSHQEAASIGADSIKEVMTVKRILDQIEHDPNKEIAAIIYGVLTKFDINAAVVKCCLHCKRHLLRNRTECANDNCNSMEMNGPRYIDKFSVPLSIADHSGTLNGRLADEYAQKVLGYTAQALKELPDDYVDAIFNRFILQRFALKVIVKPKSTTEYFATILAIDRDESDDMASALKL